MIRFPFRSRWKSAQFALTDLSRGAQRSLSGADVVTPSLSARWTASLELITWQIDADQGWAAFVAQMQGRLGTTAVPVWQRHRPLDALGREMPADQPVGDLSGGAPHELFGFANDPIIDVTIREAAPLRATEIIVDYINCGGIRPGHKFSIGGRLYVCRFHAGDGSGARLQISPPLRAAAAVGDPVEVRAPICLMRFQDDNQGAVTETPTPFGTHQVNFVEVQP